MKDCFIILLKPYILKSFCALLLALSINASGSSVSRAESGLNLPDGKPSRRPDRSSSGQVAAPYMVQGKAATKEQYEAARLNDEGLLLLRANANEQALEKFKKSMAIYDGYPEIHHSLAVAYAKTGRSNDAIAELRKATELNPSFEDSWLLLAGLYQAAGNLKDSAYTYIECLRRFPESRASGRVNSALSILYSKLGKSEEAVTEMKLALEADPDLPAACYALSAVLRQRGDTEKAAEYYSGFLKRFPSDPLCQRVQTLLQSLRDAKKQSGGPAVQAPSPPPPQDVPGYADRSGNKL